MFRVLMSLLMFLFVVPAAQAHVGYLVPLEDTAWSDSAILSPGDVLNTWIVWVGLLGLIVLFVVRKLLENWLAPWWGQIVERAEGYREHVPWILRLSLGIALMGAGSTGYLLSPVENAPTWIATLEVIAGFFLLSGFLLAPTILFVGVLWLVSVVQQPYTFGNIDFFAAVVGLIVLADARPGVDHLFAIPFFSRVASFQRWVPVVLRVGVGAAMLYLAVFEKFLHPMASAVVFEEHQLANVVPVSAAAWVYGAGFVEAIIGLGLIFGTFARPLAALAFVVLSLSFFYFGEAVYAHVTLFGVLSCVFILGDGGKRYA